MSGASLLITGITGVVCALAGGFGAYWLLARRNSLPEIKFAASHPEFWPLQRRTVVSNNEAIIWRWLRATFPNQRVLVKVPFSRFTAPTDSISRSHFDLLNSMYTSFCITDREGNVLGCIELSTAPSRKVNPSAKQDILDQLGITYEILDGSKLPTSADFRAKVLARSDEAKDSTVEEMIGDARHQLHELLGRQRVRRHPESNDFRPSDLQKFDDVESSTSSWHTI